MIWQTRTGAKDDGQRGEEPIRSGWLPIGKGSIAIVKQLSEGHEPIQIRADILRDWKATTAYCTRQGFTTLPDNPTMSAEPDDAPAAAGWSDEDVKRAILVAKEAGLPSYRVEIAPNGTIAIVVTESAPTE